AAAGLSVAAILYFYFAAERSRMAAMEDTLATFVAGPAFSDVRAKCQTDPANVGTAPGANRAGPSFDVFASDGESHAANAAAKPVPRASECSGQKSSLRDLRGSKGRASEILRRPALLEPPEAPDRRRGEPADREQSRDGVAHRLNVERLNRAPDAVMNAQPA